MAGMTRRVFLCPAIRPPPTALSGGGPDVLPGSVLPLQEISYRFRIRSTAEMTRGCAGMTVHSPSPPSGPPNGRSYCYGPVQYTRHFGASARGGKKSSAREPRARVTDKLNGTPEKRSYASFVSASAGSSPFALSGSAGAMNGQTGPARDPFPKTAKRIRV